MKKTFIAIIVVLAAALVGIKYMASKKQAMMPAQTGSQQQAEQAGVALPSTAKDYTAANTESVYVPVQSMGNYEIFSLPPAVMAMKGACEGGSPKEIMDNHNKTWGFFTGRNVAFESRKTLEMYDFIANYYACQAAARQDITTCNELPGEIEKDGVKIALLSSPLGACREKSGLFLLKAYIAGKAKDKAVCMGYFGEWDPQNLAKISPPDFCDAAAQGPEKIMAYAKEKLPEMAPGIQKMLAFSKDACNNDPVCLANNGVWEGIKSGNPGRCPAAFAPHCAALAQKSQVPCGEIIVNMSKKYCEYYKELLKKGGGFAGITAEEAKEKLREMAEKKAAEDKARKDQEAVMKQTNERVKKMIGKKGGE